MTRMPTETLPIPTPAELLGWLSNDLGISVADLADICRVRYFVDPLDPATAELVSVEQLVIWLREDLDTMCVRSVPDYWWPGHDPAAGTGATKMR